MKFMRYYLLSLLLLASLTGQTYAAADLCTSSVISQTDASNGSGTMPSWSGSAAPSTIDDAGRALQGAIARDWNWRNLTVTAGGTADAKTLTYSVAPIAYCTGQQFSFIANTTNTGSATLNVNSLGAKTIKKDVAGTMTVLAASDMVSGARIIVMYDGTDMIWMNRGNAVTTVTGPGSATDNAVARFDGTGGSTIQNTSPTTISDTGDVTTTSTDAGATNAPLVTLDRNSASPAVDDQIGHVIFSGRNDAASSINYAGLYGQIVDPAAGSEDGQFRFRTSDAGSYATRVIIGQGLFTSNVADKGSDTINAEEYYKSGVKATRALICTLTTTSGTTQSCTSIPAYRELYIEVAAVSFSASATMQIAVSDDNGSNYGTARNIAVATGSAGGVLYGNIRMSNIQTTDSLAVARSETAIAAGSSTGNGAVLAEAGGAPAVINAIQFSGGTFDAGTIRVYGLL